MLPIEGLCPGAAREETVGESGLAELLIGKLGYVGIALLLILGGLGLPVPEEAPIILAAVLSKTGRMDWPVAFASCFGGVLIGDFIVYGLGYYYGERVLSIPLTRKFLTREREAQIKGYFHRHGFKILILGRFAPGFRTAAYLTAGILKLPPTRLFLTDLVAASLSTSLMFGLGYVFAHQIQSGFDRVKLWLTVSTAVGLAIWLLYRYYKARRRAGKPVGPPVLVTGNVPLPPDDLLARQSESRKGEPPVPDPAESHPRRVDDIPAPPTAPAIGQPSAVVERPIPGQSDPGSTSPLEIPLDAGPAPRLDPRPR
jgi:membrane protein DedA with SNARE-associated domain